MRAEYGFRQLAIFTVLICFQFTRIDGVVNQTSMPQQSIMEAKSHLTIASDMIKMAQQKLTSVERTGLNSSCQCRCTVKPGDCKELQQQGYRRSGGYKIWPRNRMIKESLEVYCDMTTEGGGWTVFQRRGNFERPKDYFNKNWNNYKDGFGNVSKDHWLGNSKICAITTQKCYQLKISLTDWENRTIHALYDKFWLDGENQGYALHVEGYSGNAGDSLVVHNGARFSTFDRDNDQDPNQNKAATLKAAWWYVPRPYESNLNGQYMQGPDDPQRMGVEWVSFQNKHSFWKTEMMIRPVESNDEINNM